MQKRFHKYFWDGLENWGSDYELRRIIEYADFPDLIKYPFSEVQLNISKIPFEKLRTSEERKEFITKLAPFVNCSFLSSEIFSKISFTVFPLASI